jgi:hypothetical protein
MPPVFISFHQVTFIRLHHFLIIKQLLPDLVEAISHMDNMGNSNPPASFIAQTDYTRYRSSKMSGTEYLPKITTPIAVTIGVVIR